MPSLKPRTGDDVSPCPVCHGSGLEVLVEPNGERYARECGCRRQARALRLLRHAQIPRRYEHCLLDSYEPAFRGADASLAAGLLMARRFAEDYPVATEGKGLLLTGSIGVGKTHLAVGILHALIREKGVPGLFCDYRELLKQIQHSYNPQVATTELEILGPVFNTEVLVLDELGAAKPTDWVWDTVALILNTRYNRKQTTIITTNYPNLPPAGVQPATRAVREETLGDRITERMRSRLAEMCVEIPMQGDDFRQRAGRARFA